MKISLATNFDDKLIDKIKKYNIYEIYGRLNYDIVCGGRPSDTLEDIPKQKFEAHVRKCREAGINFNYLFNGACLGNREYNKTWQKEVLKFTDYLVEVGVNSLTVTNPLLLKLIKKYYPQIICRVSTFACVDSLEKALYWEEIGADIICVDFVKINRDFDALKIMVKYLKRAKIEVLATNSCLKNCPYIYAHINCNAHASTKEDNNKNIDWCLFACQAKELRNKEEYIKSPWIRPEDIHFYEEIGIEHFKLTERGLPTEILVKRVKAYYNRKYDGNLLDLIQGHGCQLKGTKNLPLIKKSKFKDIDDIVNEIKKIRGLGCERKYPLHYYIDNKKLDGFIENFVDNRCKKSCATCTYCKTVADRVIIENKEIKDYLTSLYSKLEDNLY